MCAQCFVAYAQVQVLSKPKKNIVESTALESSSLRNHDVN